MHNSLIAGYSGTGSASKRRPLGGPDDWRRRFPVTLRSIHSPVDTRQRHPPLDMDYL